MTGKGFTKDSKVLKQINRILDLFKTTTDKVLTEESKAELIVLRLFNMIIE